MLERIGRWIRYNLIYLGHPPWDTGVSPPELLAFLKAHHPGRVLDVGCGTGTNLLTLAEHGWQVVGIDLAWLSVLRARKKLRQAGYKYRVIHGDVTSHLAFKDKFDLILDIGCYHSLSKPGRARYRQNLRSWLNFDGVYLLYAHLRNHPESHYGFSEEDVQAFGRFLDLCWRADNAENRLDGGGGRPASWMQFIRKRA